MSEQIYEQLAKRTNGDVYIGGVGPVRVGTDKVIHDHANIGIVVTTDGTVNNIARSSVVMKFYKKV